MKLAIHPSIGVARVGNSPTGFYLSPATIGGLPLECDEQGNETGQVVQRFKDSAGRVRRQAAQFRIFRYDESDPSKPPAEVTLDTPEIAEMRWTVHLANKKASWYEFLPLIGDDMLGPENTYQNQNVDLRNKDVKGEKRRKLIIDPGPRELSGRRLQIDFSPGTVGNYPHASFPEKPKQGHWVRTLGEIRTDDSGRLLVLGGFGHAGGDKSIANFAGADTWNDDVSDGPITCELQLKDGSTHELRAWVIIGAPKVAPELVNLVTLDDVIFDVAVRFQNLLPDLCWRDPKEDPYKAGAFKPGFRASYNTDIEPIIRRPLDYLWVANIPSMAVFGAPPFDPADNSEQNRSARKDYFRYFRRPGWGTTGQHNDLFLENEHGRKLAPLMPLNSGSNSVRTNRYIDKFLALTETQYFLLQQWADGKFDRAERPDSTAIDLDRRGVGNCVGSPMCPGIEVTWNFRNPKIFVSPYRIRFAHDERHYAQHGLDPSHDETSGDGCEPGDLTKRMAIPWQADFFNCTAQFVNFTDPTVNKDDNLIPVPPTYYSYWWPPQSPMYVISSQIGVEGQRAAGVMAGYPVSYQRGINTYAEAIEAWSYLAFIVNQNISPNGRLYGYFVEQERNEEKFLVADVALGGPGNLFNPEDQNFTPFWTLLPHSVRQAQMLALDASSETGEPVKSPIRTDRR